MVDDTPNNLRLLSTMLTQRGYDVRKALNGRMAINSVQADLPDLILMDIKMPEMSGYEVCELIKADPETTDIPIIFISALDDTFDKVKAFEVGGLDYITKPFQEAEVLARVESQLRLKRLQNQLISQNQELQFLNRELSRSNRELEQFAHIVSHDLQQPLQSISGFAQLLQMKVHKDLDTASQDYLTRIMDAAQRMQRLIQDVLHYSQVGRSHQEMCLVDCNQVLMHVIDNLRGAIAESEAQVASDTLPTVVGNEIQLVQLFQNLLSNALKFRRDHVPPQIIITATQQLENWRFEIRDNGFGMSEDDCERVFDIFQRSPLAEHYPGTGIGLATCKKIIDRHGGQIWAKSQVGQGTSFFFTVPQTLS